MYKCTIIDEFKKLYLFTSQKMNLDGNIKSTCKLWQISKKINPSRLFHL